MDVLELADGADEALVRVTFANAEDGDIIRLTGSGSISFTGFTADILSTTSHTVELGAGVDDATFAMGAYGIDIKGQVGGTTQTWNGPILVTKTADTHIIVIDSTLGNLTVTFNDVTTNGDLSSNPGYSAGSGFSAKATTTFATIMNCTDCVATDNGNDGFAAAN